MMKRPQLVSCFALLFVVACGQRDFVAPNAAVLRPGEASWEELVSSTSAELYDSQLVRFGAYLHCESGPPSGTLWADHTTREQKIPIQFNDAFTPAICATFSDKDVVIGGRFHRGRLGVPAALTEVFSVHVR